MFVFEKLLSKDLKKLRLKVINHEFWKRIENGTLDKKRLQLFALQDYWLVDQANRIDCLTIASIKNPLLQKLLLERLAKRVSYGHTTLTDFAEGLGMSKKDFLNIEPLAGCMALTAFFYWMIDHTKDMEKIAAIDASKEVFSLICVKVQKSLMKHYSLSEKQTAFFTLHEGTEKRLQPVDSYIEKQCENKDTKKLVLLAIRLSYEYELLFYDTLLNAVLD